MFRLFHQKGARYERRTSTPHHALPREAARMKRVPSILLVCLLPVLAGCSMSPSVKSYSVDYADAMEAFSNEMIVRNILRAKEHAPLHFADLSQITGSIQLQASMGATFPFGLYASTGKVTDQLTPGIQFQSSPTFNVSPLDTQSFTLNILQPIQAQYFAHLFDTPAVNQRLIWYLFISSIRDGTEQLVYNNPTDSTAFNKYQNKIDELIKNEARPRAVTVLVPAGPQFHIGDAPPAPAPTIAAPTPTPTPTPSTPAPSHLPTLTITDVLPLADEITYHLEYAPTDKHNLDRARLYRRFDNQLALCGNWSSISTLQDFLDSIRLTVGSTKGSGKDSGGGTGVATSKAGGSATQTLATLATPVLPLVGKLPTKACDEPVVLEPREVEQTLKYLAEKWATTGIEIRLRSVREVFDYLGATLNMKGKTLSWVDAGTTHVLFALTARDTDSANALSDCKGTVKGVLGDATRFSWGCTNATQKDHTAEVLALLSELVNASKVSADIATTKQVQVVP